MMKLLVFTAAFYGREGSSQMEKLNASCQKFDIDLVTYGGDNHRAFNFYDAKINDMGVFLNNNKKNYTHALYTDAADSMFLATLEEIISKYNYLGSPKLITSAEKGCHPFGDRAEEFPPSPTRYRFMNPGNFIGEIPAILDVLGVLKKYKHLQTNDQGHWHAAYLNKQLPFEIQMDYQCDLFQPMSDAEWNQEFDLSVNGLFNKTTGTLPSIVHFNGPKGPGTQNDILMQRVFDEVIMFDPEVEEIKNMEEARRMDREARR